MSPTRRRNTAALLECKHQSRPVISYKSTVKQHRVKKIVPKAVKECKRCLSEGDVEGLLALTIKESNSLHAVCRDTCPTINYLNKTSDSIMEMVHSINEQEGRTVVGYSFDAGPNAYLFYLPDWEETVSSALRVISGENTEDKYNLAYLAENKVEIKQSVYFKVNL